MSQSSVIDQRTAATHDVPGVGVQYLTPGVPVRPGDVVHVPGDVRHAWRDDGDEPAVSLLVTTARIAQCRREVVDGPPSALVERFLVVSERYDYWNASPEENAAIGLDVAPS